jgi:serine phosphatase RsbU (regulator of sigma subunit)/pSer/pThr/pTyr-binding forkhead associated (FHA) protein
VTVLTQPRLTVRDDIGQRSVTVDRSPFTIGRGVGHDLQIAGADVSRDHAEIVLSAGTYLLRDRGSRYGTFVNGVRVSEHTLAHGDRVECGRSGVSLLFLLRDELPRESITSGPAVGDLRQVSTLLNLLRQMGSERVIDEVLTLVLDSAIEATGAERGFIMLADDRGLLEMKLARHAGRITVPSSGFDTSRKIPEEVFTTGETRVYADLLEEGMAAVHTGTIALGIRHVLCTPLRLVRYVDKAEGSESRRNIGVLYLDSRERGRILSPEARAALEALATEAATAIEYARLYRGAIEKARVDEELLTASRIQQALLPDPRRTGSFFEAVGASIPSRSIGGDFFDYQVRPGDRFMFGLGDVTGKGPPAALLTSLVQGVLAAQASTSATPGDLLSLINRVLLSRRVESRFVTLFLGMLSPEGVLTYSNGGQNPPFLVTARGVERLEAGGTLVGAFPWAEYPDETRQLSAGDTVVVFSDGVTDATTPDGVALGDDRLAAIVDVAVDGTPDDLLRALFDTVHEFSRGAEQQDDVTIVVVRYLGAPDEPAA